MTVKLKQVGSAGIDMAAALGFYRLLGLDIPEGAEAGPHVDFAAGGIRLAWDTVDILRGVYDEWNEHPTGHRIELAFNCETPDEVDATYQRMVGQGYRGHKAPWEVSLGCAEVRTGIGVQGCVRRGSGGDSYAAAKASVSSSQARTRRGAGGRPGSPLGLPMS